MCLFCFAIVYLNVTIQSRCGSNTLVLDSMENESLLCCARCRYISIDSAKQMNHLDLSLPTWMMAHAADPNEIALNYESIWWNNLVRSHATHGTRHTTCGDGLRLNDVKLVRWEDEMMTWWALSWWCIVYTLHGTVIRRRLYHALIFANEIWNGSTAKRHFVQIPNCKPTWISICSFSPQFSHAMRQRFTFSSNIIEKVLIRIFFCKY